MSAEGLRAAEDKMRADGQHQEAVQAFARAYERLESDESVMIPSDSLEPAADVPALDELPSDLSDREAHLALERVAVIKLNGGLATTMGLHGPKSLMEARDGASFLQVIVGQLTSLREVLAVDVPLVLMDSEATRTDTLAALDEMLGQQRGGLARDFLQSMIPKLDASSLAPVQWPRQPSLEWCPPGHGDVYGALRRSGMLDALLEQGFEYAMISNADNLGSTVDPRIAAHVAASGIPFLMEVVQGTEADRKGGHVARRRSDGQLVLRESAQTPDEDAESFRDYRRWRYYNTNSLWVSLRALAERLEASDGVLELPLIVNRKTVDPRDSSSTAVLQLESAMGAAIGLFEGAALLRVPRTRFAPVKTTDDLLVLRSDVYRMQASMELEPLREDMPYVELDPRYYKLMDDFEQRFPDGVPSLIDASRLVVNGDVTFGAGVVVRGAVTVTAGGGPLKLDPGTVLDG